MRTQHKVRLFGRIPFDKTISRGRILGKMMTAGVVISMCLFAITGTAFLHSVEAKDLMAEEITAKLFAKIDTIQTASAVVEGMHYDPKTGKGMKTAAKIMLSRPEGLVRVEIMEPEALADQIIVVDDKKKIVRVYMPVTNQIMEKSLSKATSDFGFSLEAEGILSLPSQDKFTFSLAGKERIGAQDCYVLEARAKTGASGMQKLWVSQSDWSVLKIEVYDKNSKINASILLKDFKANPKLTRAQLLQLPEDAEVVKEMRQ